MTIYLILSIRYLRADIGTKKRTRHGPSPRVRRMTARRDMPATPRRAIGPVTLSVRGELLALSVRASRCSQRYSRVHELDRARQQREEHEEERRAGGDLSRQIQPRVLVCRRQIRRALEENDEQAKVKQNRVVARNDRLPQTSRASGRRQRGAWRGAGRGEGRHTPGAPTTTTRYPRQSQLRLRSIGTRQWLVSRLGWIGPVATLAQAPWAAGGGVAEAHGGGACRRQPRAVRWPLSRRHLARLRPASGCPVPAPRSRGGRRRAALQAATGER